VRHPVAIGLAAGLAVSLGWFAGGRFLSPAAERGSVSIGVQVAELWSANLPDLSGRNQPLMQWQGKVLVLNFWAPWCPPCREEIPGFIRLQEKYSARGLQFVGVALDEAAKVEAYVDEVGIPYPILLGEMDAVRLGQTAGNRLGGLPYTLILDRQGNPVENVTGALDEARLESLVTPLL
jgi:thiol-disulfide isomerase/thioredoxin